MRTRLMLALTAAVAIVLGGAGAALATAPVRNEQKLGRNELCWCGSGKKFKHCHGEIN